MKFLAKLRFLTIVFSTFAKINPKANAFIHDRVRQSYCRVAHQKITVEIKSLNSKQLDLSLRVPPTLREHEMELRNIIARNLERGKVEASVYVENTAGDTSVQFNIPLMKAYKAQYELMAKELGIAEPQDWYSLIVRFPDVLKSDVPTETDSSTVEAVTNAMQQAVDALMEYRRAEGHKLDEFFSTRIEKSARS